MQSVAVLDIRILNCDRNEGNILVKKHEGVDWELIPIDHALSLSDSLSICDYELCWTTWPQIEAPINDRLQAYIKSLDTRNNVRMLKKYLRIRPVGAGDAGVSEELSDIRDASREVRGERTHYSADIEDHVQV